MAPNTSNTLSRTLKGAENIIPSLTIMCLSLPILVGFLGTLIPALGFWDGLEGELKPGWPTWMFFKQYPGIELALIRSQFVGLLSAFLSLFFTFFILTFFFASSYFHAIQKVIGPFLSIPHAALAAGLLFLLAPSGELIRIFAVFIEDWSRPPDLALLPDRYGWGMLIALLIKEIPFLLLVSLSFLPAIRASEYLQLGQSMGYSKLACWSKLIWPQFYSRLRLPLYAVIAYSTAVADLPQILMGGNSPTLSVLILRWFRDPDLSYQYLAAVGAMVQFALVLMNILIMMGFEKLGSFILRHIQADGRRWQNVWLNQGLAVIFNAKLWLLGAIGIASILMLLGWSFAVRWRYPDILPGQWGFANWMRFGMDAMLPMGNSLMIAAISALIGLVFVVSCLEMEAQKGRRGIGIARQSWVLYLPLLIPQIAFLFGIQFLLVLTGQRGSYWAVIWAHLIFVVPYLYLSLAESYRRFDPRYVQLARSMGKSRYRIFMQIKLPILLSPFLVAFALGFSISMGEYLPTIFAASGRIPTLMTEAVGLASGGNRKILAVFALLQALLPFLAFMLALWLPRLIYKHRRMMLNHA